MSKSSDVRHFTLVEAAVLLGYRSTTPVSKAIAANELARNPTEAQLREFKEKRDAKGRKAEATGTKRLVVHVPVEVYAQIFAELQERGFEVVDPTVAERERRADALKNARSTLGDVKL